MARLDLVRKGSQYKVKGDESQLNIAIQLIDKN